MLDLLDKLQVLDYPEEEKTKLIKENGNICKVCGSDDINIDEFNVFIKYTDCIGEQDIEDNGVVCCSNCEEELNDFFGLFRLYDVVNFDALYRVFQVFISKGKNQYLQGDLAVPGFVQKSLVHDFWANFDKTVGSSASHRTIFYLYYRKMLQDGRLDELLHREDFFYEDSTLCTVYHRIRRSAGTKEHRTISCYGKFLQQK